MLADELSNSLCSKNATRTLFRVSVISLLIATISGAVCDSYGVVFYNFPIPSVVNYAEATRYSSFASGLWASMFLMLPVSFIAILLSAKKVSAMVLSRKRIVVLVVMSVAIYMMIVEGVYDKHLSSYSGKWRMLFKESYVGILMITSANWVVFYYYVFAILSFLFGLNGLCYGKRLRD